VTEPIDLSKVGAKPPGQPPRDGRRRPPRRSATAGPLLIVLLLVVVAAAVFVVLDPFGGDDADGGDAASVDETTGYCEASGEVDRISSETGAATAPGVYDGPPDAIRVFVDQAAGPLADLRSEAPAAISQDVGTVVDGLNAGARGDAAALRDAEFTAAAVRVSLNRLSECGGSTGTSEGD
jgi:hypothetical protein